MASIRSDRLRIKLLNKSQDQTNKEVMTNAERCKAYRERLKTNPEAYEQHRNKNKERSRENRNKLKSKSPETISRNRELCKLRMRKMRARKKSNGKINENVSTRSKEKQNQIQITEQREKWKIYKRNERSKWSAQKWRRHREKLRKNYHKKRQGQTVTGQVSTEVQVHVSSDVQADQSTEVQVSSEVHADESTEAQVNVSTEILKHERSKNALIKRRILENPLDPTTPTDMIQNLYKRKKPNEGTVAAIKFMEEAAVPVPGRFKTPQKCLPKKMKHLIRDFNKSNPNANSSLRSFYRHRPPYIETSRQQKYRQCLCEICENIDLKLDCINKFIQKPIDGRDVLSEISLCKSPLLSCYNRECDKCGIDQVKKYLDEQASDSDQLVKWYCWETVAKDKGTRKEKVLKETSLETLIELTLKDLQFFSKHVFTHRWQFKQYKSLINNLEAGHLKDTAVVVSDFAENFLCQYQDEVSSAHWGYNQVTLHPNVLFYPCGRCGNLITDYQIFLSDDLNHDAHMVNLIMEKTKLYTNKLGLKNVITWSDGCAAQYKSKLPFYYLSKSKDQRAYFGSRHGKGPCDSCGGVVKRIIQDDVVNGQVIVQNAEQMFEHLNRNYILPVPSSSEESLCHHTRRQFRLIKSSDVNRSFPSSALKTVAGTRSIHSLYGLNSNLLAVRNLSCFCNGCLSICDKKYDEDSHNFVDEWKEKKIEYTKEWSEAENSQISAITEFEISACRDTSDVHADSEILSSSFTDLLNTSDIVGNEAEVKDDEFLYQLMSLIDKPSLDKSRLKIGQYVKVSLPFGKTRKEYVAEITDIDDSDEFTLNYMEMVKENVFKWPIIQDKSKEPSDNIIDILPDPTLLVKRVHPEHSFTLLIIKCRLISGINK